MEFDNYDEKLSKSIYDQLGEMITKYVDIGVVKDFIKPFLGSIKENQDLIIYQQPIVIIIYYLAQMHSKELEEKWDLTLDMLQPIFDDLGIYFDSTY